MKATRFMKKALVAVLVFAGSLGMMSFTAQQMGICVKQTVTIDDGKVINAYYVQQGTGYAFIHPKTSRSTLKRISIALRTITSVSARDTRGSATTRQSPCKKSLTSPMTCSSSTSLTSNFINCGEGFNAFPTIV